MSNLEPARPERVERRLQKLPGLLIAGIAAAALGASSAAADADWHDDRACADERCEEARDATAFPPFSFWKDSKRARARHAFERVEPAPPGLDRTDWEGRPGLNGPATAVPEPSSFLVFAFAALAVVLPLRRFALASGAGGAAYDDLPNTADPRVAAKRALDVAGALVGLALAAPVVARAPRAIRLDSPGGAFFRQTRVGRDGRPFGMWKLRTMVAGAETLQESLRDRNQMSGPVFKLEDDPRVTRAGRWLRRYSIDELPQLWNVLRGEMSLVGPRPPLPSEVAAYGARERRRLDVKPGLTCTWQVSGRHRVDFDDWMEMDLDYVENWSLKRDVALICKTVPVVVRGTGA